LVARWQKRENCGRVEKSQFAEGEVYAQTDIMEYRFPERSADFGVAESADVQRRVEYA
jgi:hypothetical protein